MALVQVLAAGAPATAEAKTQLAYVFAALPVGPFEAFLLEVDVEDTFIVLFDGLVLEI